MYNGINTTTTTLLLLHKEDQQAAAAGNSSSWLVVHQSTQLQRLATVSEHIKPNPDTITHHSSHSHYHRHVAATVAAHGQAHVI
jgi:hypothetical protein